MTGCTIDRIVGYLTGRALVWLGKRSHDRGDWHEFNHCYAALKVGNSVECTLEDCSLRKPLAIRLAPDNGGSE